MAGSLPARISSTMSAAAMPTDSNVSTKPPTDAVADKRIVGRINRRGG